MTGIPQATTVGSAHRCLDPLCLVFPPSKVLAARLLPSMWGSTASCKVRLLDAEGSYDDRDEPVSFFKRSQPLKQLSANKINLLRDEDTASMGMKGMKGVKGVKKRDATLKQQPGTALGLALAAPLSDYQGLGSERLPFEDCSPARVPGTRLETSIPSVRRCCHRVGRTGVSGCECRGAARRFRARGQWRRML